MMNSASGRRVPGGALPMSTRVESLATVPTAKRTSASFASDTAPGRRNHRARPAATPTLVIISRAARKNNDSVGRVPIVHTIDEASSARLAGFHMVRMKTRNRIPTGTSETKQTVDLHDERAIERAGKAGQRRVAAVAVNHEHFAAGLILPSEPRVGTEDAG